MGCSSCEERAKLLLQARDAFYNGDLAGVERILKDVFGTVKIDVQNLGAMVFRTKEQGTFTIKEIAVMDPNNERSGIGGMTFVPDHVHDENNPK